MTDLEWYQKLPEKTQEIVDEMLAGFAKLGIAHATALAYIREWIEVKN